MTIIFYITLALLIIVFVPIFYFLIFFYQKKINFLETKFFKSGNFFIDFNFEKKLIRFNFLGTKKASSVLIIPFEKFFNNFKIFNKESKIFKDFFSMIVSDKMEYEKLEDFLKEIKKRNIVICSTYKFPLGKNYLFHLYFNKEEINDNHLYASGHFLNFLKFNYFEAQNFRTISYFNSWDFIAQIKRELKKMKLDNYFVVCIYDVKLNFETTKNRDFRFYLFHLFYLEIKNHYKHVYLDENEQIYLLHNQNIHHDLFLLNQYWIKKISILYKKFCQKYQIPTNYNDLIVMTGNYRIKQKDDDEKIYYSAIFLNLLQKNIENQNFPIDYYKISTSCQEIYKNYQESLNLKITNQLLIQKRLNIKKPYAKSTFSLEMNSKEIKNFENFIFYWKIKIYQKFLKNVGELLEKNQDKNYKLLLPSALYPFLDLKQIYKYTNINVYFRLSEFNYHRWHYLQNNKTIFLPPTRFGFYIDEENVDWENLYFLKPRNIWIKKSLEQEILFDNKIEYLFKIIKNYQNNQDFSIKLEII